jgi:carboxyl-terminal processing protease
MLNRLLLGLSFGFVILTSCKKETSEDPGTGPPANDQVKDSTLAISKEIYLWYNQIPATFNAQSYSDPDKIMSAIRQYSKEPGFTNPVDRWSFAIDQSEWDDISGGISQDFGMSVFFLSEDDLRVKFVERSSPAAKAGIRRGWRITKINNNTNITTGNANFIVNAVFESATGSFTFQKPDGTSADISLTAATYQEDPFLLDTIYTVGASKAGYIVFNSFLGDTTAISNKLASIFGRFATAGVNDVIVDLRYNGGGYVSVQEKFANYLINNAGNGGVMMNEQFNDKYASFYNSTMKFSKLGSLNLNRVFFIVSNNTASASELLINNLKPYMQVKLVGPTNTYGKPVGYFPIEAGSWYVFPVSFRSTNKNGEGNYFGGFAPDKVVGDGLNKDWGDKDEASLASVLKYLNTGTFGFTEVPGISRSSAVKEAVLTTNTKFEERIFKGMIDKKRF